MEIVNNAAARNAVGNVPVHAGGLTRCTRLWIARSTGAAQPRHARSRFTSALAGASGTAETAEQDASGWFKLKLAAAAMASYYLIIMSNAYSSPCLVADAPATERAAFIRRTYLHLAIAIFAFAGIEVMLFQSGAVEPIMNTLLGTKYSWLIVLACFIGVSWLAEWWANSTTSIAMQYLGLGLYVVAEAVIFVPLLSIAVAFGSANVLPNAIIITGLLFLGLTVTAFTTRKDFSFLGSILKIGSFVALGVIVASYAFGFTLGLLFSSVMVMFAAAAILYTTSNIIHKYNTNQHVAAALSLFAAVALLFWYVLRILLSIARRA